MAHHASAPGSFAASLHTVSDHIGGFFRSVGTAMVVNSSGYQKLQKVQRLQAKTDVELAEMGLKREDITRFVFHDLYLM